MIAFELDQEGTNNGMFIISYHDDGNSLRKYANAMTKSMHHS